MTAFNSGLLTPPSEEEEIRPYRAAWRSLVIEQALLLGVTIVWFVVTNFIGIDIPQQFRFFLNLGVVVFPLWTWGIFSVLAEQRVPQPRLRLVSVFVITALTANAVGYPLLYEYLKVDEWLSLTTAVQRIMGYTFTVGIVQETLKYIVVRSMIWDSHLRTREDAIAYAVAAALGYAAILNLHFIGVGTPPVDAVAIRVFGTIGMQIVSALIVSYGLAESYFSNASGLLLPVSLALGALVTGLAIPLRSGLVNASLSTVAPEFVLPRPLFGIGFSVALLAAGMVLTAFFYNTAERQAREIEITQE